MKNGLELIASAMPRVWLAYAFAVGAVVGSFLNVVIARVPAGESIVHPRSRCPRCKEPIAWFDNLPILSWLALRARCRHCALPISARYPIVEALVGILALAIAREFGPTLTALGFFAFTCALVALAYIDLDTWLLPSEITLPLLFAGLLSPLWNRTLALPISGLLPGLRPLLLAFISSAGAALAGGLFLAAIAFIGERLGREWMGWGDVWLLAGIGAWLGLPALLPVMMLASVQGAIVGIVLLVSGRALGTRESGEGTGTPETKSFGSQPSPSTDPIAAAKSDESGEGTGSEASAASGAGTASEEFDEDDWVPPPTAVPFGPFLVLGALEQLLLGERIWSAWIGFLSRLIS